MPSTDKNPGEFVHDENLRRTIRSRLRELGISAREASRRAGFNVGYVGDVLEGRSKAPEANRLLRLAETLEFDAGDFLGDSFDVESSPARGARTFPEVREPAGERVVTVPLYAAPLPMAAAFVKLADQPIGQAQALPLMGREPIGYAITVPNNLNAPRYFVGETLYVKPGVTPKEGDFVVVKQKADGKVAIGRLVGVGADSLTLQFVGLEGSESSLSVSLEEVESVHWIMAVLH